MLSLLAASVAVMAMDQRRQPLLGDDRNLEEALPLAPMQPPTKSTIAVNRAHREVQELRQQEAEKAGPMAAAAKFTESVKDEGSGKQGVTRAFEKVLIEWFFQREWFDLGHLGQRVKPLGSMIGGCVLGLGVTSTADAMATTKYCPQVQWMVHYITSENAKELVNHLTAAEACQMQVEGRSVCQKQVEGLIEEYRTTVLTAFTLGFGLGLPMYKHRRYLANLVFRCPHRNGRLYEVDDDQKMLNAVTEDLEMLHEVSI